MPSRAPEAAIQLSEAGRVTPRLDPGKRKDSPRRQLPGASSPGWAGPSNQPASRIEFGRRREDVAALAPLGVGPLVGGSGVGPLRPAALGCRSADRAKHALPIPRRAATVRRRLRFARSLRPRRAVRALVRGGVEARALHDRDRQLDGGGDVKPDGNVPTPTGSEILPARAARHPFSRSSITTRTSRSRVARRSISRRTRCSSGRSKII